MKRRNFSNRCIRMFNRIIGYNNICCRIVPLWMLAVAFLMASCSDFLEKAPTTQLSTSTFWRSEADAYTALTGVYRTLRGTPIGNSRLPMLDALTDNGWSQYNNDDGRMQEIANGVITALTGGVISEMWNNNYWAIAHCNIFLSNIDNVTMSDALKRQYKGEVQFLRAQYYFMLTQFFGDVPLVLVPLTVETMKQPRDPYNTVLNAIYEDLDAAINVLPDVSYNGHAVKASALALKARIQLFNNEFSLAAATAKQVIDGGKFDLYDVDEYSYLKLFSCDGEQNNNPEIIFSVKYLRTTITSDIQTRMGAYTAMSPLDNFMNDFEPGDWRKTLVLMDTINNTWWPLGVAMGNLTFESNLWQSPTGFGVRKWSPITWDMIGSNHDPDVPLMRYAEVLLNYAEAKNEESGPDQSVYDAINKVRERARLGKLEGLDQNTMREAIRHERRMELCYEGQRWMDLKRWKLAGDVIPKIPVNFREPDGAKRIWTDVFYYWPIQQAELDKDDNLKQTTGY